MTNDVQRHIGTEEVEEYSLRRLPEAEVERIEEHMLLCSSCRELVEDSDSYLAAMRGAAAQLRREEQQEGPPKASGRSTSPGD